MKARILCKKNIIFLFIILASVIFIAIFSYFLYKGYLIKKYISLSNSAFTLEDKIINHSSFSYSVGDNDLGSLGTTPKYILKDSITKERWIFKINPIDFSSLFSVKINRFMRFCGIATPPMSSFELPINNKVYRGTMQKFVSIKCRFGGWEDFDPSSNYQVRYLTAMEIFAYLFNIRPDFILGEDNRFYAVDLDDIDISQWLPDYGLKDLMAKGIKGPFWSLIEKVASCKIDTGLSTENYNGFLKQYSVINFQSPSLEFDEALKLIDFIAGLNDKDFLSMFIIDELKESNTYKMYLKYIVDRKKNMKKHFKSLWGHLMTRQNIYPSRFISRNDLLPELKRRIAWIEARVRNLNLLLEHISKDQIVHNWGSLSIPSSPEAWFLLSIYQWPEINFSREDVLYELRALYAGSSNLQEKEAIDRYIKTIASKRKDRN
ncbi:MAG: hypothetical protein ABIG46_03270 [Candidatus Omnitrophota bacterium]